MSLKEEINYNALRQVSLIMNIKLLYGDGLHYVYLYKDKKNFYLILEQGFPKDSYFLHVTNHELFKILNKQETIYNILNKHDKVFYLINIHDSVTYDNLKLLTTKIDFSDREYVVDNVIIYKYAIILSKKLHNVVRKDKIKSILNDSK